MTAVRLMMAEDVDAVMRLERGTPEAPHWARAVYEDFLRQDGWIARQIFVTESDGEIAGFLAASAVAETAELESIAVDSGCRRTGIGGLLLGKLIAWARERQAARLQLEVRAKNSTAIAFYVRFGFGQDGVRTGYYDNPKEDAILMSRML